MSNLDIVWGYDVQAIDKHPIRLVYIDRATAAEMPTQEEVEWCLNVCSIVSMYQYVSMNVCLMMLASMR